MQYYCISQRINSHRPLGRQVSLRGNVIGSNAVIAACGQEGAWRPGVALSGKPWKGWLIGEIYSRFMGINGYTMVDNRGNLWFGIE